MVDDRHVLLVEDNEDDVFLAVRTLKKLGIHDVVVARDGEEALDYISGAGPFADRDTSRLPWFILLDLKLPKVDGLEFLQALRLNEKTKCIPVVIVSSSREERDVNRCLTLGARVYLCKPITAEELTDVLQKRGLL